jgi:5-methylcytosine-specific restriction endonuclease McrA
MKKEDRQAVFNKFGGKCAYCGCELVKGWHVDHFEAVFRYKSYLTDENGRRLTDEKGDYKTETIMDRPENHTLDNFMPACQSCNLYKSTMSLDWFRKSIEEQPRKLRAASPMLRLSERYGIVSIIDKPITFYFEEFLTPTPLEQ